MRDRPATAIAGTLVLEDRVARGAVHIEAGSIVEIEVDDGMARGSAMDGPFLCPGFIDVHVHGWGGHDAMGGPTALTGMARALARRGVTSFLPTAVTASLDDLGSFAESVRRWMSGASGDGAEALGFNLEGPFLDPARRGAQNEAHIRDAAGVDRSALEPLVEGLRLMTIAPERPGALALIEWLAGSGVAVSLGHSGASVAEARAGYRAGARSTTHLFNAMSGVDHRQPGLAVAALLEDVFVELIADRQHVAPELWPLILRLKRAEQVLLVSDAVSLAGTGDGRGWLGGLPVEVVGDRCTLVVGGSLAGSVVALDTCVSNLVAEGVGLPTAVAAASANPAALLGLTDRGRLAVGTRADLVELGADLAVRRVMIGGEWLER